jgi:hypothetical protein
MSRLERTRTEVLLAALAFAEADAAYSAAFMAYHAKVPRHFFAGDACRDAAEYDPEAWLRDVHHLMRARNKASSRLELAALEFRSACMAPVRPEPLPEEIAGMAAAHAEQADSGPIPV